MRRLYMSDLDSTIIGKNEAFSDYSKVTINSLIKRGLKFTLNTSRTPASIKPVIKDMDFSLPIILMNGSCVYDTKNDRILEMRTIKSTAARRVVAAANALNVQPFVFELCDNDVEVYYTSAESPGNKRFLDERKSYYKRFNKCDSFKFSAVPYIIIVGNFEILKRIRTKLQFIDDISYSFFKSDNDDYCFLEVYSSGAGKKNAAERFIKQYNFDYLTAFGDNLNDIEMLEFADYGVAVADGKSELKAVANEIIGPQSDDSVAKYLLIEWSRQLDTY